MPESMFSGGELAQAMRLPGCLLFAMTAMCIVLGMAGGAYAARVAFEKEAVQHGAARWIVDDEGRREFVWNEGASGTSKRSEAQRPTMHFSGCGAVPPMGNEGAGDAE